MHISLICPAAARDRSGNRATAVRWAGLLSELGHRVSVAPSTPQDGTPVPRGSLAADMMIAVHAYRSAADVAAFRDRHATRPLVVLMAGTDIYRFARSHPTPTNRSMALADRLVGLHDLVHADIPAQHADKLRIIAQSARPLSRPRQPSVRRFDICVVGHLREEKDPFRAALAARLLPAASRLRVVHLGKAHDEQYAERARQEMRDNPRYLWRGDVPGGEVRRLYGRSHLMVMSSLMEGGANVVSEAVVAGLPVVASRIPGNVGLLGTAHPAYYPVADTAALAQLLRRAEDEPAFLAEIQRHAATLRPRFAPAEERHAWQRLIAELA